MNFTDNHMEREMREIPCPTPPDPEGAPGGSRCEGCPYWRGIVCVSCYKKLLKEHFAGR